MQCSTDLNQRYTLYRFHLQFICKFRIDILIFNLKVFFLCETLFSITVFKRYHITSH